MNKRPDENIVLGKKNTHPAISILIVISIFITGIAFCCTLFSFLSKAGIVSFISLAVTIISFITLLFLIIIEQFFSMVSGIETASNKAVELLEKMIEKSSVCNEDKRQRGDHDSNNESTLISWQESQIKKADAALASGKITQEKYDEYIIKVKSFTKVPESHT